MGELQYVEPVLGLMRRHFIERGPRPVGAEFIMLADRPATVLYLHGCEVARVTPRDKILGRAVLVDWYQVEAQLRRARVGSDDG